MGAGPTKRQVRDARRAVLQKAARKYGGSYCRCRFDTGANKMREGFAEGDGWCLITRLLRASNGEASLLFMAYIPGSEGTTGNSGWHVSSATAFKAIGIKPL